MAGPWVPGGLAEEALCPIQEAPSSPQAAIWNMAAVRPGGAPEGGPVLGGCSEWGGGTGGGNRGVMAGGC